MKVLNYDPTTDWQIGLELTVSWYKNYFEKNKFVRQDGFKEQEKLNIN